MAFGMFSAQASPVAIDFGSASVKMLQIGTGERPSMVAAAEVPVPDSLRAEPDRLQAFYAEWLPKVLKDGKFKGKRAVIAIPSANTFVQHMQINEAEASAGDEAVKAQLQIQMGCPPSGVVVRSMDVCTVHRNGQPQRETICLAIAKDVVMRHVELIRRCKVEVVGVHTDIMAMIRAFDHINRRTEDVNVATMFVDLGWGGTRVAITHGQQIVFARYIPIGGKNFDQLIASTLHCDLASARAHRLTLQSSQAQVDASDVDTQGLPMLKAGMSKSGVAREHAGGTAVAVDRRSGVLPPSLNPPLPPAEAPRRAVNVDLSELLDTITDELSMCLRYHQSLFGDRAIDRAIFVGGESRQSWLCQHIVKVLRVPAQMGDPLARLDASSSPATPDSPLASRSPAGRWYAACAPHRRICKTRL